MLYLYLFNIISFFHLQCLIKSYSPRCTYNSCTFQVLSDDGAILQYKGFIDRGARLESRFSKRPIKIRGSVTFQMRDGEAALMSEGYRKDMLPIASGTGTTRFLMTKS